MAAAAAALPVAQIASHEAGGVIRAVLHALEKPIFTNLETVTVTHRANNGDIITRTRTHGWTIPLGVPVLFIGAVTIWEIGLKIAQALAPAGAAIKTAEDLLNPVNFAKNVIDLNFGISLAKGIAGAFGINLGGGGSSPPPPTTGTVLIPPTFMAHLSLFGQQVLTIPTAIGQQGITRILAAFAAKPTG